MFNIAATPKLGTNRFINIFVAAACCLTLGSCGGSSNSGSGGTAAQPLEVSGNWTATAANGGSIGSLTLDLVPSPCDVTLPDGSNLVSPAPYSTCFIAETAGGGGQGSLSFTGAFLYPPEAVFIGIQTDPVPANGSEAFVGILLETSGLFPVFFDLNGTIQASTKSVSGSFACDQNSLSCIGISGTLTGAHQ